MAIFSVSDIVISATLLINAFALISSKFPYRNAKAAARAALMQPNSNEGREVDVLSRFQLLVTNLRKYSFILAVWNIVFILLMTLVFH